MKLLDTCVLVDSIRRGIFKAGSISVITLMEVLRGTKPEKRNRVKELLEESFEILPLDNETILKYCELYDSLRRKGMLIPDADLLIAATAIANNLVLVTKDRDFEWMRKVELKVRDERRISIETAVFSDKIIQ